MTKYALIILVLLISSKLSLAQSDYSLRQTLELFSSDKISRGEVFNTLSESEIEGSPYLNDDFINGTVYTNTKTKYVDVPMRYNIYIDNIEFNSGDKVLALAAPETVDRIEFGDYTMVYAPYSITKKIKRGFFLLEEEGKASLLIKPEVEYVKATKPAAYKQAEPAKFDKKADSYYIRVGEAEAKLILNKKDMIGVFPDHENEVEAFIKKNKIKQRKVEDLKQLVQYYNSL